MSLSLQGKRAVVMIYVCLAAAPVGAQQYPLGRLPQTVSVATLQVPAKAWKHFDKARAAADHNRLEQSQQESSKALEIAPGFAKAYILRASIELHERQYDKAIADVEAAQRSEPNVFWASVLLAGAYNSTHRYKDARLMLDNMRGPEADTWQADYERSRTEIGSGRVEAALYWSAMTRAAAPRKIIDVYLVRANALLLASRWEEARSELTFYLNSSGPQAHHDEALATLEMLKARIDAASTTELAAR